MQNAIQKFRQSSIVFEKPGILSENLKTLTCSNYPTVQFFYWNVAHVFYLPLSKKGVYTFISKSVKNECLETRSFSFFANNWRSKQNKKNPTHPTHPFVGITK